MASSPDHIDVRGLVYAFTGELKDDEFSHCYMAPSSWTYLADALTREAGVPAGDHLIFQMSILTPSYCSQLLLETLDTGPHLQFSSIGQTARGQARPCELSIPSCDATKTGALSLRAVCEGRAVYDLEWEKGELARLVRAPANANLTSYDQLSIVLNRSTA